MPGIVKSKTASLIGPPCLKAIEAYNSVEKSFMACSAIDLKNGASNSFLDEYEIKKKIIEYSKTNYLLVDHTKFNKVALKTFAEIRDFDAIITDKTPEEKYLNSMNENRVSLMLAEK